MECLHPDNGEHVKDDNQHPRIGQHGGQDVNNGGQHRLEVLEIVEDLHDAEHTEYQHHVQHLAAIEAVLTQLFDHGEQEGRADHEDVEQVPQLSAEHDEAKAVDLEQNLEDEDGEEAEFEAVEIEEDEDGVEQDNSIEKVAKGAMLDDRLDSGG